MFGEQRWGGGAQSCSVRPFLTPWTVACQVPLSMGFPRQEYWNRLPFLTPGDFPHSGIETKSLESLCIGRRIPYNCSTWEAGTKVQACF